MAQRRMLSKRISQSKKVNKLSIKAQIVWTWTIPYLDDYGCYTGDPEDIKAEVFPKNRKISRKDIAVALAAEAEAGLIVWYTANGGEAVQQYRNFDNFQTFKSDRPRISEYPQYRPNTEGVIPVGNQRVPEGSLSKVNTSKEKLSKTKYTKEFELFWKKFKGRYNPERDLYIKVGKFKAFGAWEKLTIEEQRKAWAAADKVSGRYTPDACRWLEGKMFDDF